MLSAVDSTEYAKFTGLAGHVQQNLKMSGKILEMSSKAQNNFAYSDSTPG